MTDRTLSDCLARLAPQPRPLTDYSTANLSDAMQRIGVTGRVLEPAIRPLLPFRKMVGVAVTLKLEPAPPGTGRYVEHYSRAFAAGLEVPSPILVIEAPPAARFGAMGSGGAHVLRHRYGFVGCVLEGVARDTDDLRHMAFQVYFRAISPEHLFGTLRGVSVNEPVVVGGLRVSPGDVLVGDNDGLVAVPAAECERILTAVDEDLRGEDRILREIDAGGSYLDVVRRYQPDV